MLWLVVATCLGCGRIDKAKQCGKVADTINRHVDQIEQLSQAPRTPTKLKGMASQYRQLAQQLGNV